jgi:DNA-directed RNA polymerase subunit RPC12/RpoP
MTTMKTIKEHNKIAFDSIERLKQLANKTGVKCPRCVEEVELLNSSPGVVLLSYPPQINVHCPVCSYTGYLVIDR